MDFVCNEEPLSGPADYESSPEAIRKAQLSDVAEALKALGPTATIEQVQELTCLPLWNIRRALVRLDVSLPSGSESAKPSRKHGPPLRRLNSSQPSLRTV